MGELIDIGILLIVLLTLSCACDKGVPNAYIYGVRSRRMGSQIDWRFDDYKAVQVQAQASGASRHHEILISFYSY